MVASNDRRYHANGVEHIRVKYEYAIQDIVLASQFMLDLSEPSLLH